MNTLERIVQHKKNLLSKKQFSFLKNIPQSSNNFKNAIQGKKHISLIAEIKRSSPSQGNINPGLDLLKTVPSYEHYASAISVLTEKKFFSGSLLDLEQVRKLTHLPLLRKDFIIDPRQVLEARQCGADAFLLIVAILSPQKLQKLLELGREYNMHAVVEIHDKKELEIALSCNIDILGINNRNLQDLTIDRENTLKMLQHIPTSLKERLVIISESGFSQAKHIRPFHQQIDAILVGSSLMSSTNIESTLKELTS